MKLSKLSQGIVDDMCESAMHHGWQRDQGSGSGVDQAKKGFDDAKTALEFRLAYLEQVARINRKAK